MQKRERTEKSKYQHTTTGAYCTAAAFVAEKMCLNKARKENVGNPAYNLWNTKKWKKLFQYQVVLANGLMKEYPEHIVVKVVLMKEYDWVYSLRTKKLLKRIESETKIWHEQQKQKKDVVEAKKNPSFRTRGRKKQSSLSKLKAIENAQEKSEE